MSDSSTSDHKDLPKPPSLKSLIGPSFILLGMGLGSGELILWPSLVAKFGLGIIWGALVGITFQFFINMEVERYTLATGESVFVGIARKLKIFSPLWFIFSTLIPWMWPGIVASSSTLLAAAMGIKYSPYVPITLLFVIGIILTLGPVLYKTQETFQKTLIFLSVPLIFLLVIFFAQPADWGTLASGLIGKGDTYWLLPIGIPLAGFLGAFAYSGAGGNLNLAQSFYIKEKGYGMGKYSGRITSVLTGKSEDIELTGTIFNNNSLNIKYYRLWWKRINIEHFLVFWATGLVTMLSLAFIAYLTVFGDQGTGLGFVINEALVIGQRTIPVVGTVFLLIGASMLFSTQLSVLDATSRIMSENLLVLLPTKIKTSNLPKVFYFFLWFQIIAGIIIFSLGFTEPLFLVTLGAVLNAMAMVVYIALLLFLNTTSLHKAIRPSRIRSFAMSTAFLFFLGFTILTIHQNIR